ncbi:MAG: phenylacetate--CoA ligase [Verrucomicrobia bacterium]|nr:phenylacetate--CoA ligase [Verrucomicrobiota bacterium]
MLASTQWDKLRGLLDLTRRRNLFYQGKWASLGGLREVSSLAEFTRAVPFTTKSELSDDQQATPPFGTALNFPLPAYTRCHQTSGTSGQPLRWLDTFESWEAMTRHWTRIFEAAGTTAADRVLFAFSFGPFLGFWLAFDSAHRLGCCCVPAGGLSTTARLRLIFDLGITTICCTPSYALRLTETAREEGVQTSKARVSKWIVAGEPGGSIPATRQRIEQSWPGSVVYDHHGMTETGPVTYQCPQHAGRLHVMESAFLAEIIDPHSGQPVSESQPGELVLTTLERAGSPLFRYRTGDIVKPRPRERCDCGSIELALEGGILSRTDDMLVVRGVNIYPTAIESLVRSSGPVLEFLVHVSRHRELQELAVDVEFDAAPEASAELARRLETQFESALSLRIPVAAKSRGSLPRYEMKARRWIHHGDL